VQTVGFLNRTKSRKSAAFRLLLLVAAIARMGCDSPTEVRKGALVRTLYERGGLPGRYVIFWDGRDEDGKTVAAGAYQCYLEAENYTNAVEMTALDGTRGSRADSMGTNAAGILYIPTDPALYSLSPNIPNPFYNRDGTSIPFEIAGTGYVRVRIHRKL
jgi:hypothetical protein